jgi:prepilin-type N-terminal cleavage/methylation domain-containing protein
LDRSSSRRSVRGFTLAEVVMAMALIAFVLSAMILGYVAATRRTEWSGYSLAAQALAIQQLEQARSAKWDVLSSPNVCEITNIPTTTWANLDIPYSGENFVRATNFATIRQVSLNANPPVSVYLVKVDTVWEFQGRLQTNTIANYFAPDR